jgi:hypothetical protein
MEFAATIVLYVGHAQGGVINPNDHSVRSVIIGSTRLTRRAAIQQVRKAIREEHEGDEREDERVGGTDAIEEALQQAGAGESGFKRRPKRIDSGIGDWNINMTAPNSGARLASSRALSASRRRHVGLAPGNKPEELVLTRVLSCSSG